MMTNRYAHDAFDKHSWTGSFLLLLALCTGVLLGCWCVRLSVLAGTVFHGVTDFPARITSGAELSSSLWQTGLSNGKFLLLLFLLAFVGYGTVLIPAVFGVHGFLLGYTVAAVISSLGGKGALLCLILLLFRLVLVLPYSFLLAIWSMKRSTAFPAAQPGRQEVWIGIITLTVLLLASFLECTVAHWAGGVYLLQIGV